jgi:hypothetical protein
MKTFKKAPYLKAPGKQRYQSPVRPIKSTAHPPPPPEMPLESDEPLLEMEEESEEENNDTRRASPIRVTSLRVLVWINFGLVMVLSAFFLIYVLTRPAHVTPSSSRTATSETNKEDQKHLRITFTLVPHSESNGKWMTINTSNQIPDVSRVSHVQVCCLKDSSIFSCIHEVTLLQRGEAKIRIRNSQMVGATCNMIVSDATHVLA